MLRWAEERRAALLQELEALASLEERVKRFGDDEEYEEGAVITWDRTFSGRGRPYSYAALKADGRWWLTGREQRGLAWSTLVEMHLRHADRVDLVDTVVAL